MKKTIISLLLAAFAINAMAQEKETAKTGFNFGPLPAVGYSSDLGWHYGALTDIYYYGDGSIYPDYLYKMYFEASAYSKGNTVLHASFDSPHLIPGLRLAGAISYFGNDTYNFYGFNGASALNNAFDKTLMIDGSDLAKGVTGEGLGWYQMQRKMFRAMVGLQGKIGGEDSPWGWATGLTFYNFNCGQTNNKRIDASLPSLYQTYVDLGIIRADEALGGQHLDIKAGVVYDTRDHENNPHSGTNMEAYFFGAPGLFKDTRPYINFAFHWKQFFPVTDRIVFGYHLGMQANVSSLINKDWTTPFYMLQTIPSINMKQINTEGLGSTCTLRGTASNRLMGLGFAWLNTELRIPFAKFDFIGQHFQLVVNPFIDGGYIFQPYNIAEQSKWGDFNAAIAKAAVSVPSHAEGYGKLLAADSVKDNMLSIYDEGMENNLHMSTGFGIHFIMNQNVNVSLEFAKIFYNTIANKTVQDKNILPLNDGVWGMNVGLNYIF